MRQSEAKPPRIGTGKGAPPWLIGVALLGVVGCSVRSSRSPGPPQESQDPPQPAEAAEVLQGSEAQSGTQPVAPSLDGPSGARASGQPPGQLPLRSNLPVDGFFPAVVYRPAGAGPFPVVVAAHGAGCLAEQHCAYWWELLEGKAVVVCPRGKPLYRMEPERGFYYANHIELGRELSGVLAEATRLWGAATSSWGFAGYSQGATMGALALAEFVPPFEWLVFIEGGAEGWTASRARQLAERGILRVLYACGGPGCEAAARRVVGVLGRAGVSVRLKTAPGAGHTYLGAVEEQVRGELDWLTGIALEQGACSGTGCRPSGGAQADGSPSGK